MLAGALATAGVSSRLLPAGRGRPVPLASPDLWLWPLLLLLTAVAAGMLVVAMPRAAVAVAVAPLVILSAQSAHLRLLLVTLGALLAFESSTGIDLTKLLYLAVFVLSLGVAWHVRRSELSLRRADGPGALVSRAWWLVVMVIGIALPIGVVDSHPLSLVARDAAPYLLLGAVPIIALDAARGVSRRFLLGVFVVLGLFGTASLATELLSLREFTTLPVERLFLSSFILPAVFFAYACARALRPRSPRREVLVWGGTAAGVLAALLLTGTRTAILLLAAPAVVLVLGGKLSALRRAVVLVGIGVALVALVFRFGGAVGIETGAALDRLGEVREIGAQGPSGSLEDRFAQSSASWEAFEDSPLLGTGLGNVFEWRNPSGVPRQAFTVDAAFSTVAKLGAVGALLLLAYFLTLGQLALRFAGPTERAALLGLLGIVVPHCILSNPFEDKGLALGLIFVIALALQSGGEQPQGPVVQSAPREIDQPARAAGTRA